MFVFLSILPFCSHFVLCYISWLVFSKYTTNFFRRSLGLHYFGCVLCRWHRLRVFARHFLAPKHYIFIRTKMCVVELSLKMPKVFSLLFTAESRLFVHVNATCIAQTHIHTHLYMHCVHITHEKLFGCFSYFSLASLFALFTARIGLSELCLCVCERDM